MNCILALTVVNFLHRLLPWLLVLQTQPAWHVGYDCYRKQKKKKEKKTWMAHRAISLQGQIRRAGLDRQAPL